MKIRAQTALLDVLGSGTALRQRLGKDGAVPVVIRGRIVRQWGVQDGRSREFTVEVEKVEEVKV